MKRLYKITFVFLAIFFVSGTLFAQKNLLFVGKTDEVSDTRLMEFLDLQGYSITFVTEDDFKAATPYNEAFAYDGFDAIFISEIIGSSSANNFKTAGFPIPCVSAEGYCVRKDRWDLITDNDTQFKQASSTELNADVLTLIINDVDHWIANIYGPQYTLVWSTAEDPTGLGVTGCKLNENVVDAVPIATYQLDVMAEFPSVWAIPEGATLISDNTVTLPNMVIIGTIAPGLGDYATQEFNELVVNSLMWVTRDYEAEKVNDLQQEALRVWPNPTNGVAHISFDLAVAGNVAINIYDITGKLMDVVDTGMLPAGENTIQLDLSDRAGAVYLYEIRTGSEIIRGQVCKN